MGISLSCPAQVEMEVLEHAAKIAATLGDDDDDDDMMAPPPGADAP